MNYKAEIEKLRAKREMAFLRGENVEALDVEIMRLSQMLGGKDRGGFAPGKDLGPKRDKRGETETQQERDAEQEAIDQAKQLAEAGRAAGADVEDFRKALEKLSRKLKGDKEGNGDKDRDKDKQETDPDKFCAKILEWIIEGLYEFFSEHGSDFERDNAIARVKEPKTGHVFGVKGSKPKEYTVKFFIHSEDEKTHVGTLGVQVNELGLGENDWKAVRRNVHNGLCQCFPERVCDEV